MFSWVLNSLTIEHCRDANFDVRGGTIGFHIDNLRYLDNNASRQFPAFDDYCSWYLSWIWHHSITAEVCSRFGFIDMVDIIDFMINNINKIGHLQPVHDALSMTCVQCVSLRAACNNSSLHELNFTKPTYIFAFHVIPWYLNMTGCSRSRKNRPHST